MNVFLFSFIKIGIEIFDDKELELLICGLPKIDLADLKANTEYQNYSERYTYIQFNNQYRHIYLVTLAVFFFFCNNNK